MTKTRTLVLTGGHAYDHTAFGDMLAALPDVHIRRLAHPAAQEAFSGEWPAQCDAYLCYDMPGYTFHADHTPPELHEPPPRLREDFLGVLDRGHGYVFMHHAFAAWPTWEEYGVVMGARYRFLRTPQLPDSGYRHGVAQHVTVTTPGHPVVAGLGDGFDIVDEAYLFDIADDVVPLLRTDAELTERSVWSTWNAVLGRRDTNDGWTHASGSGVVAWLRPHPRSRIVGVQFGDSPAAFANPSLRRLLANALHWVAGRPGTVGTRP